jgi:hypothetical protein
MRAPGECSSAGRGHGPRMIRIELADGVQLLACDDTCADAWRLCHLPDMLRPKISRLEASGMRTDCIACTWCSRLLVKPVARECDLHGDACPTQNVLHSDWCRQALRRLRRQGVTDLPPTGWNYLRASLELYREDVAATVSSMLRMRSEWSTPAP